MVNRSKDRKNISSIIIEDLMKVSDNKRADTMIKYFQAYKGGYGEGDCFLGISSITIKKLVKDDLNLYKEELLDASYIKDQFNVLIKNKYHEIRYAGCYFLTRSKLDPYKKVRMYIGSIGKYVNNWDLIDVFSSSLGKYVDDDTILKLSKSKNLWRQRASVIFCWDRIRNHDFDMILKLSKLYLTHPHHLQHKAVGWMLREVGKKDMSVLNSFLEKNVSCMPRTMLRYSIEKMNEKDRKYWLTYKKD